MNENNPTKKKRKLGDFEMQIPRIPTDMISSNDLFRSVWKVEFKIGTVIKFIALLDSCEVLN